jgi:hypothetical protein
MQQACFMEICGGLYGITAACLRKGFSSVIGPDYRFNQEDQDVSKQHVIQRVLHVIDATGVTGVMYSPECVP